jgi:hypothetical protein
MKRSIYAKTSKPNGQRASVSPIELPSDRPIGLSPITQEWSAEFSLQLETMRNLIRISGEQPVEAGNNRTQKNRLSQLWRVAKDPIDPVCSFSSFLEVDSNHA